jgi:glycosyltransferase EpsD
MYHGGIGPSRGLWQTIEAIAHINPKHPKIILFVLGTGTDDYLKMLIKLVEKNSLGDNVYIHKPVNKAQVPQFVGMCDMGIDPRGISSWAMNSCPLKLLEYLAMEKPFISTNIPFSAEILAHGTCGIVIPSNKPEDIAAGVEIMYEKRNSLSRMGKTGRTIVEQYYSWDEKARDLDFFLLSIRCGTKKQMLKIQRVQVTAE